MIKVKFPGIKYYRMNALMDTNSWWIPDQSSVSIEFNKLEIDFDMDLFVTEKGYLRPKVYSARLDWGDSYFYHDNWFFQALLHETVEFGLIML